MTSHHGTSLCEVAVAPPAPDVRHARAVRPCRLRRVVGGDDGVALVMAMAFTLLLSTLLLTVLAIVVNQVTPTAQARKDQGSVNAAGSGLQAALSSLRAAVGADGAGSRAALPCSGATGATFRQGSTVRTAAGATQAGTTSAAVPGRYAWSVALSYFTVDPTDKDPVWLAANAMPCPLTQTPLYAYLQSYGTGAATAGSGGADGSRGNRAQTGVYRFFVPAQNMAGGRLRQAGGQQLCLDAGSASPAVGTPLSFSTCQVLGTPQQTWEYREDLSLFFGGNSALNLCISGSTSAVPSLQRCTGTGFGPTFPYTTGQQDQLWSFGDNGHFHTARSDGDVTGTCLQPVTGAVGAQLTVYDCTGYSGDPSVFQNFDPDPEVGAGKAGGNTSGTPGSPTRQYVNFAQFGRCLDITGQQVNSSFLIAYPCKQAPDSTKLAFNQVWQWDSASGTMSVRTPPSYTHGDANAEYCLTAPASGALVTTTRCALSTPTPAQTWTAKGLVQGSPETSYTLVSRTRDQCLSVGGTRTSYGSDQIVLEVCDGSLRQRWNAPPPLPPAGLSNIREGTADRVTG